MSRKPTRAASPPEEGAPPDRPSWAVAGALFAAALVARLLFAHAGPDAGWAWSVHYKGDAPVWLEAVQAAREGRAYELGLPFRPPATAWLVDALWDGTRAGAADLKHAWSVLGALTVALFYAALVPGFGRRAAAVAGGLAAFSYGLIVVSTSPNNETPYLLLFLLGAALVPAGGSRPGAGRLAAWSGIQSAACLVRAEHLLFYALALAWLALERRATPRAAARDVALSAAVFLLALVPWHVHAWSRVAAFNRGELTQPDPSLAAVEARTRHVRWSPEAQAELERLPAFTRRSAGAFVSATLAHRGDTSVEAEDLGVLEQAFGCVPEPVAPRPFVASYGPLNFSLANAASSRGGFDRGPLEEPPPLAGGAARYPPDWVAAMPPPRLSLEYPPHLFLFNHGYAEGLRVIRAAPGTWLGLVGRKLARFSSGASLGFTGYGLPTGGSGVRRAVDVLVPGSTVGATLWRFTLLVLLLRGLLLAGLRPAFAPFGLFALSKLAVTILFFGYARQGVLVAPVVLLAVALALEPWIQGLLADRRRLLAAGAGALVLGVSIELTRWRIGFRAEVDGAVVSEGDDPVSAREHADRRIRLLPGRSGDGPRRR